jgi:hypothetical protein
MRSPLSPDAEDGGRLLAALLAGAWRPVPGIPSLSALQLEQVVPRLLQTGAASLAWWRVRRSHLRQSRPALELLQAFRLHALHVGIHEDELVTLVLFLRSLGVEPVLGKGWAVARLYPEPGLRPYGDIDLYLPPNHFAAAQAALARPEAPACCVDLHCGCPDLGDRSFDACYGRSRLVPLGGLQVRILGPEDQLRLSCLHLLRHGAWRPLWLCDCGLLLETRPADFDWDWCLRGDRRLAEGLLCALGLANQLLGARVEDTPAAGRASSLPRWLIPAVLRQWGQPYVRYTDLPLAAYMRRPAALLPALGRRWPNPIEATLSMRAPFNELPRLPFQLADGVARTVSWVARCFAFALPHS